MKITVPIIGGMETVEVSVKALDDMKTSLRDEYRTRAQAHGRSYAALNDDWNRESQPVVTAEMHDGTMDLFVTGPLHWLWGVDSEEIIHRVEEEKPTRIRQFVDSPGGSVAIGASLYNYFKQKISDGMTMDSMNLGMVASAAVMPFLAGTNRYMPVGTNLMTHEARVAAIIAGTREEIKQQYEEYDKRLEQAENVMNEIYCEAMGCSKDKAAGYFSEEQWFTSAQAKDDNFSTSTDRISPKEAPPSSNSNDNNNDADGVDEDSKKVILAIRRERMAKQLGIRV